MKKLALTLILLCWTTLAGAQPHRLQVDVPFDFFLNNQLMQAGHYSFEWNMQHVITVTPRATLSSQFVKIAELDSNYQGSSQAIVFKRIGNQNFFREILDPGLARVVAPQSKMEQKYNQTAGTKVEVQANKGN